VISPGIEILDSLAIGKIDVAEAERRLRLVARHREVESDGSAVRPTSRSAFVPASLPSVFAGETSDKWI